MICDGVWVLVYGTSNGCIIWDQPYNPVFVHFFVFFKLDSVQKYVGLIVTYASRLG